MTAIEGSEWVLLEKTASVVDGATALTVKLQTKGIHGLVEVGNDALFDNVWVSFVCANDPQLEVASASPTPSPSPSPTTTPTASPVTLELTEVAVGSVTHRINCGGETVTDGDGNEWVGDREMQPGGIFIHPSHYVAFDPVLASATERLTPVLDTERSTMAAWGDIT